MSLVNDMLRDLDQRRKESEGNAGRVKLTPASEYRKQKQKNIMPLVVVGLVVVAAGLGYTWLQMNQGGSTQQLDLNVSQPPAVVPVESEIGVVEAAPAQVVATPAAVPDPIVDSVLDDILTELTLQEQLDALAALEPEPLPVEVENQPAGIATQNSVPPQTVPGEPAASVRAQSPTNTTKDPIKDSRAPTPEQADTLAVQEALRLIANNQITQAYASLEQHLLNNPYAHQSRETYAKFLMNQGDSQAAFSLVESGLQLAPNHSGFKKVKARLLIANSQIPEAVVLLVSRAPVVANDQEYHEILASAQLTSRDYEGAALSYTGLLQQDQSQGRWWYGFAASQDSLGNVTAARQAYTRAIEKPNLSANLRRRSQDRLTALSR